MGGFVVSIPRLSLIASNARGIFRSSIETSRSECNRAISGTEVQKRNSNVLVCGGS